MHGRQQHTLKKRRHMRTLDGTVRPHSQVVDTKLDDGEVVLLHLENKMYFSLNPTGERIWRGLKDGLSLGEISLRLQEEFDVVADLANRSVLELVNELCEQKLALPDTRSS
jgi:Coenzyme PQQ synthesis protein D (PqqD)